MKHRPAAANRVGLALVGLLLALAGAVTLARALGLLGPPHAPLIPAEVSGFPAGHPWFWPAVIAGSLVVALLALYWLLVQGRLDTLRTLDLEPDPSHGATRVSAGAAAGALEDDLAESVHGERARASLAGAPSDPRLALLVVLPDQADPAVARQGINGAVTRLRRTLESDRLPAVVRMHAVHRRT
ncbi:alkaline shock response membrane anchor protein AmaP [Sphaerisporangium album]|uniref:Alkaline shock response membrane anchor protein AmaP n=1 Tax=Sphaerisporangium album TaxID=509200 RepID=A0A367F4P1_9ACTN|nr:alkaline shock response membrane anchor protein AmaP [Sphaerisporangium album]RCG25344.1 alkaline shock response membrane anchor protein AmaP [Sphaerisporangium album]